MADDSHASLEGLIQRGGDLLEMVEQYRSQYRGVTQQRTSTDGRFGTVHLAELRRVYDTWHWECVGALKMVAQDFAKLIAYDHEPVLKSVDKVFDDAHYASVKGNVESQIDVLKTVLKQAKETSEVTGSLDQKIKEAIRAPTVMQKWQVALMALSLIASVVFNVLQFVRQ